jgi:hypothetical protein
VRRTEQTILPGKTVASEEFRMRSRHCDELYLGQNWERSADHLEGAPTELKTEIAIEGRWKKDFENQHNVIERNPCPPHCGFSGDDK